VAGDRQANSAYAPDPASMGARGLNVNFPLLRVRGQPSVSNPPADTQRPHTGRTPAAQRTARPSGHCTPRMTAAYAAGLAGRRPTRSAKHFLTSPPQPGAEVRKQLHRTAPTQAKTKIKTKIKRKGQKIKAFGYWPRR
jgi:hypothetical protein